MSYIFSVERKLILNKSLLCKFSFNVSTLCLNFCVYILGHECKQQFSHIYNAIYILLCERAHGLKYFFVIKMSAFIYESTLYV